MKQDQKQKCTIIFYRLFECFVFCTLLLLVIVIVEIMRYWSVNTEEFNVTLVISACDDGDGAIIIQYKFGLYYFPALAYWTFS